MIESIKPSKPGKIAVKAAEYAQDGMSPREAWNKAVAEEGNTHGCAESAFLGLCEAGYVRGILPGDYTKSVCNKRYAVCGCELICTNERWLKKPKSKLWRAVMKETNQCETKAPNGQLDVVLALFDKAFIDCPTP